MRRAAPASASASHNKYQPDVDAPPLGSSTVTAPVRPAGAWAAGSAALKKEEVRKEERSEVSSALGGELVVDGELVVGGVAAGWV